GRGVLENAVGRPAAAVGAEVAHARGAVQTPGPAPAAALDPAVARAVSRAARSRVTGRRRARPAPRRAPGCAAVDLAHSSASAISQMTLPAVTPVPTAALSLRTTPSRCATSGCSIFIASRTTTRSPCATRAPSATATLTIVPCIGEVSPTPFAGATAAERPPERRGRRERDDLAP